MTDLIPSPLVPATVDLRGVPSVLLDIDRLLESDFWLGANGDEFRAGFCLWLKSYRQVPAGSLPDDDLVLLRLCQVDKDAWPKMRERALHGWVKCDDGRLYHPVVAEKALIMHMNRMVNRIKGAKGMEVRWNEQRRTENDSVRLMHELLECLALLENLSDAEAQKFRKTNSRLLSSEKTFESGVRKPVVKSVVPTTPDLLETVAPPVTSSVSAPEKPAANKPKAPATRRASRQVDSYDPTLFESFWEAYPAVRRRDSTGCFQKWVSRDLNEEADVIMADIRRKKTSEDWLKQDGQFVPLMSTYLNQRQWDTNLRLVKKGAKPGASGSETDGIVDEPQDETASAALPAASREVWWSQAGFMNVNDAQEHGCFEKTAKDFEYGVRIRHGHGADRPLPDRQADLQTRIGNLMSSFKNPAFAPEVEHALQTMRKLPRIDFWAILQSRIPPTQHDALREVLGVLPGESATARALKAHAA